jgi:hypothetical protein
MKQGRSVQPFFHLFFGCNFRHNTTHTGRTIGDNADLSISGLRKGSGQAKKPPG